MNELEIKEKSTVIYQLSQEVSIQNQDDLKRATEVLKGVKNHRAKIIKYWKTAKESAKKAYQEIVSKEKQMLSICDKVEQNLKSEILSYQITAQYDNHALLINVTQTFSGACGILYANIRCDNYFLLVSGFKLLDTGGLGISNFKIKIDGNKYYLYAKTTGNYQTYLFEMISESSLMNMLKTPISVEFNSPSYSETVSEPTGTTPVSYLLDSIYPVGAIYFSINNTNPDNFLGGNVGSVVPRTCSGWSLHERIRI